MAVNLLEVVRVGSSLLREGLQGRKRWISVAAYLMLALGAAFGIPLESFARELALDPNWDRDGTLLRLPWPAA